MMIAFRKAYRDLTRRRLRSFLTILGIVIGVAGLVAITSTSKNMAAAQARAYNNNSQQDMRWWVGQAPDSLLEALALVPNVATADLRCTFYTKFYGSGAWRDIYFNGIRDFQDMRVNKIDLVEGQWPKRGEVVLESSVRDVTPVQIGDDIVYRAGPNNEERHLKVVGFARSPSYPAASIIGTAVAYTLDTEVQKMIGWQGDNQVLVRLKDFSPSVRPNTQHDIEREFDKRNLTFGSYWERNPNDYTGKKQLDALVALMTIFSVVGLIIASFLVANTLSAVISEQMGEIGAMKAIGATANRVIWLYVVVGVIYGVVGTGIGLLVGIFGGHALLLYLSGLFNLQVDGIQVDPADILQAVLVGVGVTTLAALLPAWRGTSITVRKALDSYGISSTYGRGWADRLVQRLSRLPRVPAMAVRNLARRKARNAITVMAIGLATAAFLAAQSTSDSVTTSIDNAYNLYGVDAWVWFQSPVGRGFAETLRSMPEVVDVEPWASSSASVEDARVTMWGIPPDTTLYRYRLLAGRWLNANDLNAAVISSVFADSYGYALGSKLELSVGSENALMTVVGIVDDNAQSLSSSALGKVFVTLDRASQLMHRTGAADFFAVKFDNSDGQHVEDVLAAMERKYHDLAPGMLAAYSDKQSSLEASKILTILLYSMTIIVGTIGGIGIANTLTLNVLERRREIGVMRSIGARDSHMIQVFLTEALVMAVGGFLLGVVIGYPMARFLVYVMSTVLFPLDFTFPASMVVAAFAFTVLLTTLASIGPALGAARLRVSTALRYE